MNKEWTADSRITDRFIYHEALSIKNILLKQEEEKGRLYKLSDLFKIINKVDLIEVDTIEACGIDSDCIIKRTKEELPDIVESSGGFLMNVTSLDGSQKLLYITESSWLRKLNIDDKHAKNELVFFSRGNHLYFPNIEWDAVRVEAVFEDPDAVDNINDCRDEPTDCRSAYDRNFTIPNYLEKGLKDLLNESLLRYHHRLREDIHINKNRES